LGGETAKKKKEKTFKHRKGATMGAIEDRSVFPVFRNSMCKRGNQAGGKNQEGESNRSKNSATWPRKNNNHMVSNHTKKPKETGSRYTGDLTFKKKDGANSRLRRRKQHRWDLG